MGITQPREHSLAESCIVREGRMNACSRRPDSVYGMEGATPDGDIVNLRYGKMGLSELFLLPERFVECYMDVSSVYVSF